MLYQTCYVLIATKETIAVIDTLIPHVPPLVILNDKRYTVCYTTNNIDMQKGYVSIMIYLQPEN